MGNHNLASLASLSCFSQNSNAYNFFGQMRMTLKLHIMTHFDTISLVLCLVVDILNFSKLQGNGMETDTLSKSWNLLIASLELMRVENFSLV